ncbi:MAG TPA: hypothetical protein VJ246_03150 [Patescibacteria group bacterium]|nr:hypothetical protein [Patescibacteria group bacterium]
MNIRKLLLVFGLVFFISAFRVPVFGVENCADGDLGCVEQRINEYQQKITELQGQQRTLSETIRYLDSKIKLTESQIKKTELEIVLLEKEIVVLNTRIDGLEVSLQRLTQVLIDRIQEAYRRRFEDPVLLLFTSGGFGDFFIKYKYIQLSQEYTQGMLTDAESQKVSYDKEKTLKEQKQAEIELKREQLQSQRKQLQSQQEGRRRLLVETRNSESVYQAKLAQAREEYEAIQNIIAGKGEETEVGNVKESDRIATIIQGSSCNSSGAHVHFIVSKNGVAINPFSYLRGGVEYENCSGSSCGSSDGDSFNPSGSWRWPIEQKIKFSQGFGYTWAVQNTYVRYIYKSHNGIDINSMSSSNVFAVRDGKLFRGSYRGNNGCSLRYVRLEQGDGVSTFYLHINYM